MINEAGLIGSGIPSRNQMLATAADRFWNARTVLASALSVGRGLLVAVAPAFNGSAVFSQSAAMSYLGFLVVTWTAAFAAGNLIELRKARIAEYAPVLDVDLQRRTDGTRHQLVLIMRNIGRGYAVRLNVVTSQYDTDGLILSQGASTPSVLAPGADTEVRIKDNWYKYAPQEKTAISSWTSRGATQARTRNASASGFKVGAMGEKIVRVRPPHERPREDLKLKAVQDELDVVAQEFNLASNEGKLTVDIDEVDHRQLHRGFRGALRTAQQSLSESSLTGIGDIGAQGNAATAASDR